VRFGWLIPIEGVGGGPGLGGRRGLVGASLPG
jgi:hypothetical protein